MGLTRLRLPGWIDLAGSIVVPGCYIYYVMYLMWEEQIYPTFDGTTLTHFSNSTE